MTQSHKVAIGVIGILVLAAAAYYGYQWYQTSNGMQGPAVFKEEPATLPSGTSTSDSSLQEDTAAIDAQLKGLDSDTASADATIKESAQVQ